MEVGGGLKSPSQVGGKLQEFGARVQRSAQTVRDWLGGRPQHLSIRQVFDHELEVLRPNLAPQTPLERARLDAGVAPSGAGSTEASAGSTEDRASQADLSGLSFSGGGIRSATFNLGVLQGLAQLGLLRRFDYLSTVSGGGYVGGWLVNWIRRRGVHEVEAKLKQPNYGGREVTFLREYSNYLTPRRGLLGADAWALISTYTRNLVLNQLMLALLLSAALSVPFFLEQVYAHDWWTFGQAATRRVDLWLTLGVSLVALLALAVSSFRDSGDQPRLLERPRAVFCLIVVPMMLAGYAFSHFLWHLPAAAAGTRKEWSLVGAVISFLLFAVLYFVGSRQARRESAASSRIAGRAAASWELATAEPGQERVVGGPRRLIHRLYNSRATAADVMWATLTSWVPGAIAGWLFFELGQNLGGDLDLHGVNSLRDAFLIAPLLSSLVLLLTSIFMLGILGRIFVEETREWVSRAGGAIAVWGGLLIGLSMASLYLPAMIRDLLATAQRGGWDRHLIGLVTSGWLGTTLGGLLLGRGTKVNSSSAVRRLFLAIAPYIFVGGLIVLLSLLTEFFQQPLQQARPLSGFVGWIGPLWASALPALILGALGLLTGSVIDINVFSLNALYRNRLTRCFLGATNPARADASFATYTGFDPSDDAPMAGLSRSGVEGSVGDRQGQSPEPPVRPLWIVNAALNVVAGRRLAVHTRKAYNFAWTPFSAGYTVDDPVPWRARPDVPAERRYCSAVRHAGGVTLGQAMSISGAAVSPYLGANTAPALNFLLTVFNVRLGGWFPNTKPDSPIDRPGPRVAAIPILRELLGLANAASKYVYLSDGGHFENLGVYELVRRGCQYLVVCDAEHDPQGSYNGLGGAIEKCRTDFGVDIEIDWKRLIPDPVNRRSAWHCAVGRVRYDRVNPRFKVGRLLYLKSSLSGDEPGDVLAYGHAHPEFPHQSTGDQWFDENQFESYRALGEHIVHQVIGPSVADLAPGELPDKVPLEELFVRLEQRWYPPSPVNPGGFTRHTDELSRLFEALRTSKHLEHLDFQCYPEWPALVRGGSQPASSSSLYGLPEDRAVLREGFYLANRMIQLMENVYLDLEFENYSDHPDNRGWMNLFKHWSWSNMFRATWAMSASTYGQRFQVFCRRRLNLDLGCVTIKKVLESQGPPSCEALAALASSDELNFVERGIAFDLAQAARQAKEGHSLELETGPPAGGASNSFDPSPEATWEDLAGGNYRLYSFRFEVPDVIASRSNWESCGTQRADPRAEAQPPEAQPPEAEQSGVQPLLVFKFGFCIVRSVPRKSREREVSAAQRNEQGETLERGSIELLLYMRVQDHLRQMGLARRGLEQLMRDGVVLHDTDPDHPWIAAQFAPGDRGRFRSFLLSVKRTMAVSDGAFC